MKNGENNGVVAGFPFLSRASKFPLPLPLTTPATQARLSAKNVRAGTMQPLFLHVVRAELTETRSPGEINWYFGIEVWVCAWVIGNMY